MGFTDRVRERALQAEDARGETAGAISGGQDAPSEGAAPTQPSAALPVGTLVPAAAMRPRFEYQTEVLTSVMGRDKLRTGDLDAALRKRGDQGWELVSCNLDADLKGSRDGHLLIFKRQVFS